MALLNPRHWTLNAYTNGAWTDLVAVAGVLAEIVVCNTTASPIAVSVRLTDAAGNETAVILPTTTVAGNVSRVLDVRSLSLQASTKVQVQAAATGVHFVASGAAAA